MVDKGAVPNPDDVANAQLQKALRRARVKSAKIAKAKAREQKAAPVEAAPVEECRQTAMATSERPPVWATTVRSAVPPGTRARTVHVPSAA